MVAPKVVGVLVSLCVCFTFCDAWWNAGHMKVAYNAVQLMSASTRNKLLHDLNDFRKEYGSQRSHLPGFESVDNVLAAALYLDDVKTVHNHKDSKLGWLSASWHFTGDVVYFDKHKGSDFGKSGTCKLHNRSIVMKERSDREKEKNLPAVLYKAVDILRSGQRRETSFGNGVLLSRKQLFAVVIHLVADLYQPFHATSVEHTCNAKGHVIEVADQGGNFVNMEFASRAWREKGKAKEYPRQVIDIYGNVVHEKSEYSSKSLHSLFDYGFGVLPESGPPSSETSLAQMRTVKEMTKLHERELVRVYPRDPRTVVEEALPWAVATVCELLPMLEFKTEAFQMKDDRSTCRIVASPLSKRSFIARARDATSNGLRKASQSLAEIIEYIYSDPKPKSEPIARPDVGLGGDAYSSESDGGLRAFLDRAVRLAREDGDPEGQEDQGQFYTPLSTPTSVQGSESDGGLRAFQDRALRLAREDGDPEGQEGQEDQGQFYTPLSTPTSVQGSDSFDSPRGDGGEIVRVDCGNNEVEVVTKDGVVECVNKGLAETLGSYAGWIVGGIWHYGNWAVRGVKDTVLDYYAPDDLSDTNDLDVPQEG